MDREIARPKTRVAGPRAEEEGRLPAGATPRPEKRTSQLASPVFTAARRVARTGSPAPPDDWRPLADHARCSKNASRAAVAVAPPETRRAPRASVPALPRAASRTAERRVAPPGRSALAASPAPGASALGSGPKSTRSSPRPPADTDTVVRAREKSAVPSRARRGNARAPDRDGRRARVRPSRASGRAASGAFAGPRAPAAPRGAPPPVIILFVPRARGRPSSSRRARGPRAGRPRPRPPPRSGSPDASRRLGPLPNPRGRVPARARRRRRLAPLLPKPPRVRRGISSPGSPGPPRAAATSSHPAPRTSTTGQAMANSVDILLGVGLRAFRTPSRGAGGRASASCFYWAASPTTRARRSCGAGPGRAGVRDGEALPESFRSGDEDEENGFGE